MATLVCAYGISILTNCGLSELVAECIFYVLQISDTDYTVGRVFNA